MLTVMPTLPEHLGALRAPHPGDMGWVVSRRGALHASAHGWDAGFEALVARVVADFVDRLDARREACRIAERSGQTLALCLVQATEAHYSFGHQRAGEIREKTL